MPRNLRRDGRVGSGAGPLLSSRRALQTFLDAPPRAPSSSGWPAAPHRRRPVSSSRRRSSPKQGRSRRTQVARRETFQLSGSPPCESPRGVPSFCPKLVDHRRARAPATLRARCPGRDSCSAPTSPVRQHAKAWGFDREVREPCDEFQPARLSPFMKRDRKCVLTRRGVDPGVARGGGSSASSSCVG